MLHLEVGKFGCLSIHLGGPKQQDHNFMNAHICMQGKSGMSRKPMIE